MSAIRVEYHAQDWKQLATEAAQRNLLLVAALSEIAKSADNALDLRMTATARDDVVKIRRVALDAIAANKETKPC